MRESEFQGWLIDVARRFSWRVYHVPAPMRAARGGGFVGAREAAGLPDLILLHEDPPRLIFAELKGSDGRLSEDQKEFLRLARNVADAAREAFLGDALARGLGDAYALAMAPVGVYVWKPGDEEAIETILRAKVLVA